MALTSSPATAPGPLTARVIAALPKDVAASLALAVELGGHRPAPGDGSTRDLWEALATLAAHDLGTARAIEPHLDAMAILREVDNDRAGACDGTWGVFAAQGGPDPLIVAVEPDGAVTLSGTKPWCSLADRLDHALVAVAVDGASELYAVDMHHSGVQVETGAWVGRGLIEIPSGPVRFDRVPARRVGAPDDYLQRPGFAWGGIGVAACWYGGAVGIARTVHAKAAAGRGSGASDPHLLAHLGAIDEGLESARRALSEAAAAADDAAPDSRLIAKRVRATVARVADDVISRAGRALGPAPLALDAAHAKRVADLQLYVRQHHAERDLASLGSTIADGPAPW